MTSAPAVQRLRTEEAASRFRVKAQTMRAAYCRHGSYYGIVPVKTPNRMLLWPADEIDRLLSGEGR